MFLSDLQLESLEELPPLTELGELVLPDLIEPADSGEEPETFAEQETPERGNADIRLN